MKIVLVTGLWGKKNSTIFMIASKLIDVLNPLSDKIIWIVTNPFNEVPLTENKVNLIRIENRLERKSFSKAFFYFLLHQSKIMIKMLKLMKREKVDVFFFAHGSDLFLFPMLLGRVLGKKVILRSDGRPSMGVSTLGNIPGNYYEKTNKFKVELFSLVEKITYLISNGIIPESKCMLDADVLEKYSKKIIDGGLYVDTTIFHKSKPLNKRKYQVGYIGTFFKLKGILEFAEALSFVLDSNTKKAIIIGKGELDKEVEEILIDTGVKRNVKLIDWIENNKIPYYLNQIQVLVVPSYIEGLPNIILEAMSCGTIVLASPIGGIPDVIKDKVTGFILENNSPECIAKNITNILKFSNLDEIGKNAQNEINEKFTFRATVERYKKIL